MSKVRYAVVGAGWISQEAFMPSIPQTTNSELSAIVTGNAENAAKLAEFYGIKHVYNYDQFDQMIADGVADAVYVALPNSLHAEYTIRALNGGLHALVEKPLALTEAECRAMIEAANASGKLLMTAYRLHNEPGTVEVLEQIRKGAIGDPRFFVSSFSFQSAAGNHRLLAKHWGGPLQDIGVYCLNAARHVFGSEPTEIIAMKSHGDDPRFTEVEEMIAATLRFPGDRIAQFIVSFGAGDSDRYTVMGTRGEISLDHGYKLEVATTMRLTAGGQTTEKTFPHVDHFAGQAEYFSECILNGQQPESDGAEGLADVVALRAIERASLTGQAQHISLPPRPHHPTPDMVRQRPITKRRLVF